jgi:hypothetical protein
MRALSICQPFAHLVLLGHKQYETRSRATRYRAPVAIHASLHQERHCREVFENPLVRPLLEQAGFARLKDMPTGAILGTVEIVDCIPVGLFTGVDPDLHLFALSDLEFATGLWSRGRWAWRLFQARLWRQPVPVAGQLGIWRVPDEALQSVTQPGVVRW